MIIFVLLSCFYLTFYGAEAVCSICQTNNAACINETSYFLCYGGSEPYTDQLFTCSDGLVCTDLPTICFQRSERQSSCGDTDSCGLCNADLVFACTSRTTFAFCFGATIPTNVNGTCPTGSICDASTQDICIQNPQPGAIICNKP